MGEGEGKTLHVREPGAGSTARPRGESEASGACGGSHLLVKRRPDGMSHETVFLVSF